MHVKFSIILPTYNCNYLENAIDSVINQNYKNWELIVIDNNSTNDVYNIIKNKRNKKIKYFKINNNGVIGKSRNFGVKKSKYPWIAFLDSDDLWYKEKLTEIKKKINSRKYDFYYHNMHIKDKAKRYKNKKLYNYSQKNINIKFDDLIVNGNDIIQSSVVVKKKFLSKIGYISEKKTIISWEDFDTWLRISKITNKFCLINKCLGKYHISDDKKKKHSRFISNIKHFKKKYKSSINQIMNKYNLKKIWWIEYALALESYNKKKYKIAKKKFNQLKIKDQRMNLNITFVKFKIFFKEFFN